MNKQLIALSLGLLIVPACGRRQVAPVCPTGYPIVAQATPTPPPAVIPAPEQQEPCIEDMPPSDSLHRQVHEEVDPFTLEEEENLFNKLVDTKQDAEEDLAVVSQEDNQIGDIDQDSARYGFKRIYYDFNDYAIRPDQEPAIEHNLKVAKDLVNKQHKLVLDGHACNSAGSTDYNMMLSEKRAQNLANYFEAHGINKRNMRVVGRGSEMRIVPFGNKEQQAPNRRVEVYAYKK